MKTVSVKVIKTGPSCNHCRKEFAKGDRARYDDRLDVLVHPACEVPTIIASYGVGDGPNQLRSFVRPTFANSREDLPVRSVVNNLRSRGVPVVEFSYPTDESEDGSITVWGGAKGSYEVQVSEVGLSVWKHDEAKNESRVVLDETRNFDSTPVVRALKAEGLKFKAPRLPAEVADAAGFEIVVDDPEEADEIFAGFLKNVVKQTLRHSGWYGYRQGVNNKTLGVPGEVKVLVRLSTVEAEEAKPLARAS
jgi:hypothetical protein